MHANARASTARDDAGPTNRDLDDLASGLLPARSVLAGSLAVALACPARGALALAERLTDLQARLGWVRDTRPLTYTDTVIASRNLDARPPTLDAGVPVSAGHLVAAAARLGWGARAVAGRLTDLGFQLGVDPAALPARRLSPDDAIVVSRRVDGHAPWLNWTEPIAASHLVAAAGELGWGIRAVAERLAELGLQPAADPETLCAQPLTRDDAALLNGAARAAGPLGNRPLTRDDAVLLRSGFDVRSPGTRRAEPVNIDRMTFAAARLGWGLRAVAERLTELGFQTAVAPDTLPAWPVTRDDGILVSASLGGPWLWLLDPRRPVATGHLVAGAARLGWEVRAVAQRMTDLGFQTTVAPDALPAWQPHSDHAMLFSLFLNGRWPWLDPREPVPPGHLVAAAARLGWEVRAVARLLTDLGFDTTVAPDALPAWQPRSDHIMLFSLHLDGRRPWLDPSKPVSPDHLIAASTQHGWMVRAVSDWLVAMGFQLAPNHLG